jgi:NitT/TauT family transport system substrate-binding protein
MDYTKQVLALKNKALDATIMGEPFATALVEEKVGVRFMNTNDYFPNYVVTVFLYGPTLLEERREVGDRFMRALMRGMRDYNDALDEKGLLSQGNDDIINAFEREFRMTPKQLRSMFSHSVDPNGEINMKSVAIDWDFLVADGQISGKVKPEQLLDTSFAKQAAASLGPYVRKTR